MNLKLLETLLHQEESDTLDCKVTQYPFVKASDDQKSELLKDILAFANSCGQTDRHILIGVEEVKGGRSKLLGISPNEHLEDPHLQQFVSSKTNRPVQFSYSPVKIEGVEIGVLAISAQQRPLFLTKKFGRLSLHQVYIRRGSSTGIADPEEVAEMGAARVLDLRHPTLEIEFGDSQSRQTFGMAIELQSRVRELQLPVEAEDSFPVSREASLDYIKELANYTITMGLMSPVRLLVHNRSQTAAENVVAVIKIRKCDRLRVLEDLPDEPIDSSFRMPNLRTRSTVEVTEFDTTYEVRSELGTVQPGTDSWAEDPFYLGATGPISFDAEVTVSGNNLPIPIVQTARFSIRCEKEVVALR